MHTQFALFRTTPLCLTCAHTFKTQNEIPHVQDCTALLFFVWRKKESIVPSTEVECQTDRGSSEAQARMVPSGTLRMELLGIARVAHS